ncbi:MAG: hypothetical protein RML45_04715, partial [Acetobacteraceae bacterium]|nr:hypothetical protein [Acetobacteraceae bacterium]
MFATALSLGARAANEAGQGGVRVLTLSAPDEATTDTPARCLIALLAPAPVSALLPPCAGESESARAHHARALENRLRGADLMADRIAALASLCPSEI